jgi:hypothetical protein
MIDIYKDKKDPEIKIENNPFKKLYKNLKESQQEIITENKYIEEAFDAIIKNVTEVKNKII